MTTGLDALRAQEYAEGLLSSIARTLRNYGDTQLPAHALATCIEETVARFYGVRIRQQPAEQTAVIMDYASSPPPQGAAAQGEHAVAPPIKQTGCTHDALHFGSGDYYLFCQHCGAKWVMTRAGTDQADPSWSNIGKGCGLSGHVRSAAPPAPPAPETERPLTPGERKSLNQALRKSVTPVEGGSKATAPEGGLSEDALLKAIKYYAAECRRNAFHDVTSSIESEDAYNAVCKHIAALTAEVARLTKERDDLHVESVSRRGCEFDHDADVIGPYKPRVECMYHKEIRDDRDSFRAELAKVTRERDHLAALGRLNSHAWKTELDDTRAQLAESVRNEELTAQQYVALQAQFAAASKDVKRYSLWREHPKQLWTILLPSGRAVFSASSTPVKVVTPEMVDAAIDAALPASKGVQNG